MKKNITSLSVFNTDLIRFSFNFLIRSCNIYPSSKLFCLAIVLLFFNAQLTAQVPLGTTSFATGANNTLAASAVCTSDRSVTHLGFRFTLRSGANCALTNGFGGTSDGHINFTTTPVTTGIWQEGRIGSSDNNEFRLNSFQFGVLTAPFVNKTITVTGYRDGVMVTSATAVSPVITATGLGNVYEVDVNSNSAFYNIDEIRLVPSGTDAQGTLSLLSITLSAAITTLPVDFVKVEAVAVSNGIDVRFFTAHESNVKEYEIQVSSNGTTFSSQATVPARNEVSNSYRTLLKGLPGRNYVRVRSTDLDGFQKYSSVVVAGNVSSTSLEVFPNPNKGLVYITNAYDLPFVLSDLQGRTLRNGRITNGTLDIRDLNAGMYLLRIGGTTFKLKKE